MTEWKRRATTYQAPVASQIVSLGWRGVWDSLRVAVGRAPSRSVTFSMYAKIPEGADIKLFGAQQEEKKQ